MKTVRGGKMAIAAAVLLLLGGSEDGLRAACHAMQWTVASPAGVTLSATRGLLSADFDNDGKADLLGLAAAQVGFAPGNGSGGFAAPLTVSADPGAALYAFVTGDFNADGLPDVAVADDALSRVLVYTRGADGRFAPPTASSTAVIPVAIAAGDFNGDNKLDVAIQSWDLASAIVMAGDGSGHFSELARSAVTASQPIKLVSADVDGDGRVDLAVAHYASTSVDVLFGRGDGAFDTPVVIDTAHQPEASLAFADLNGDGFRELVTVSRDDDAIAVNANLGGRLFAPPRTYPALPPGAVAADNAPVALAAADFSGDGLPDVVTTAPATNSIVFFNGRADGTLDDAQFITLAGTSGFVPSLITTADFNADGRLDLGIRSTTRLYAAINRCGDSKLTVTTAAPIVSSDQSATLTATAVPVTSGAPVPTGTVSFREGTAILGEASLVGGTATFIAKALTAGAHTISATYEGDENYALTSADVTQEVTDEHSRLVVAPKTSAAIEYGTSAEWEVRLYDSAGAAVSDFKADVFRDGSPIGSGTAYGSVFYAYGAETVIGPHSLSASFPGDATHPPATATFSYETARGHAYLDIAPSWGATVRQRELPQGVSSTAPVTLTRASYGEPPSGRVTATIDGQFAAAFTWPVSSDPQLSLPGFAPGVHYAEVFFEGDEHYVPATNRLSIIVYPVRTPVWMSAQMAYRFVTMTFGPVVQGYRYSFTFRHLRTPTLPDGGYAYTATASVAYNGIAWEYWQAGPCEVRLVVRDPAGNIVGTAVDVGSPPRDAPWPSIWPGQPVLASDFTETLWLVNQLRWAAYLTPLELPSVAAGLPVRAADLAALRAALDESRLVLGALPVAYTRPIQSGDVIRAADLREVLEAAR